MYQYSLSIRNIYNVATGQFIKILLTLACVCWMQIAWSQNLATADSLYLSGQWQKAITAYRELEKSNTSLSDLSKFNLGVSLQQIGENQAALDIYKKLIAQEKKPAFLASIYVNMALIHATTEKWEDVYKNLEAAVTAGFSNLGQLMGFPEFKSIHNDQRFAAIKERVQQNLFPCLKDPKYAQFDFWVGEWNVVKTGTSFPAGTSKILKVAGGCAIEENWQAVKGAIGKSLNYIDPVTQKWEQTYIGSFGGPVQRYINGEYKDGAMVFLTEYTQNGVATVGRFSFHNQGPNQVRQHYETSSDGGKTWTTSYDLTYIRTNK